MLTTTQPTVSTQPPANVPAGPQPSVTGITPNVGSTDGTYFKITGAGFVASRVTVGGISAIQTYSPDSSTIHVTAPAHAAGTIDVVVTNADGQQAVGGFTYVQPESLEANGTWEGGADSNYETLLRFTIQGNALTSISCGTSTTVAFDPPVPIIRGAFAFLGANGTSVSGKLLSSSNALGSLSIPSCVNYPWFATKQQ